MILTGRLGLWVALSLLVAIGSSSAVPEPDGGDLHDGGSDFVDFFDSSDSSDESEFNYDSPWSEVSRLVTGQHTLSRGGEQGFYSKVLTLTCPSRPATLERDGTRRGLRVYLHRANDHREPVIYEARDKPWRAKDIDWLVRNGFDTRKPTIVFMGGWRMNYRAKFLRAARRHLDRMAQARGNSSPYNLLIVDWLDYGFRNYGKSVAMVPHVGRVLSNLFEQLIDRHHYRAEQLQLVAFSLSTHIIGLAARYLQANGRGLVDQITAVDPTGVCFHRNSDKLFDREFSLRATDAKLVVARHYNMRQLGAGRLIGGVDILVNGGSSQPRMSLEDKKKLRNLVNTMLVAPRNHHRAIRHEGQPLESSDGCQEVAYECPSLDKFNQGQCAECGEQNRSCMLVNTLGNVELGLRPSEVNYKMGTVMHITTGKAQYCTHNYQIVVELNPMSSHQLRALFDEGKVKFKLNNVEIRPQFRLDSPQGGTKYTQLLKFDQKIARLPKRFAVYSQDLFNAIESVSINYLSNISPKVRADNSLRYCPDLESANELAACSEVDNLQFRRLNKLH